jgi:hypothetical protein
VRTALVHSIIKMLCDRMEAGNFSSKSLQNLKYEETLDKLTNVSKNVLQLSFYS